MEKRGWRHGDGDAVMGTWGWGCGAGDVGTGDSGDGVAGWTQHRVAPLHPAALSPTHPSLLLLPALLRLNPRLLLPAGTGAQCRLRLHLRVPGTAQGAHGDGGHPRAPGSGPRAEPSHRCSSMRCSFSLQRRSRSAASLRSSSMRSLSHLLRSSSARRRSSSFRCSSSRCTAGTQRDGTPQPPSAPTHTPSPPPAPRRSPVWCGGSPAPGWSYGSWCPAEQRGSGRAAAPAGTPRPVPLPRPAHHQLLAVRRGGPPGARRCGGGQLCQRAAQPLLRHLLGTTGAQHGGGLLAAGRGRRRPHGALSAPPPSPGIRSQTVPGEYRAPFPAALSRSRCGAGSRRGISPQGVQGWGHGRGAAPAPQGRAEQTGQDGAGAGRGRGREPNHSHSAAKAGTGSWNWELGTAAPESAAPGMHRTQQQAKVGAAGQEGGGGDPGWTPPGLQAHLEEGSDGGQVSGARLALGLGHLLPDLAQARGSELPARRPPGPSPSPRHPRLPPPRPSRAVPAVGWHGTNPRRPPGSPS